MFHQVPITVGWKETVLNVKLLDASIHDQQLDTCPLTTCFQVLIFKPVFNQLPGTLRKDALDPVEDSCKW